MAAERLRGIEGTARRRVPPDVPVRVVMFEHVMDIVRPFRGGEDTSRDTDATSSRPAERAWSMTRFHARTWAREDPAIRSLLRRKILRHARLRDALAEALGERLGLAREFRRFVRSAMNASLV